MRHSEIPEAVLDNITGYLVDERDVDGMGAAMTKLFDHPERAASMGAAGWERILAHFTQELACDRLRALMGFPAL
jgi:colanic acid/amylovoran biosynthesis glycosyltransferase